MPVVADGGGQVGDDGDPLCAEALRPALAMGVSTGGFRVPGGSVGLSRGVRRGLGLFARRQVGRRRLAGGLGRFTRLGLGFLAGLATLLFKLTIPVVVASSGLSLPGPAWEAESSGPISFSGFGSLSGGVTYSVTITRDSGSSFVAGAVISGVLMITPGLV